MREAGIHDPALEEILRKGDREAAEARLEVIEDAAKSASESFPETDEKLDRIFSDRAFQYSTGDVRDSPMYRITRFIGSVIKFMGDALDSLLSGGGLFASGVAQVLYWVLIVLAIVLLVLAAALLLPRLSRRAREAGTKGSGSVEEEYVTADAEEWLRRAEVSAQGGDWRSAVRLLFMATLRRMDERNLIRYERGVTNWQYVRRAARAGGRSLSDALTPLTLRFEQTWYGEASAGRTDYDTARQGFDVVNAVTARGPA